MNISSILSSGIDKVVDSVGTALDKLITSDEEREQLKNALLDIKLKASLESEEKALLLEKDITERWKSDNENTITRIVRPAIVVWSFTLFTFVVIGDGNIGEFTVKNEYIPIISTVVITTVLAYFGSRGGEKMVKTIKGL